MFISKQLKLLGFVWVVFLVDISHSLAQNQTLSKSRDNPTGYVTSPVSPDFQRPIKILTHQTSPDFGFKKDKIKAFLQDRSPPHWPVLARLKSQSSNKIHLAFHRQNNTVTYIKGKFPLLTKIAGRQKLQAHAGYPEVMQFFVENKNLLRLQNPIQELQLSQVLTDQSGNLHLRYQQMFKGIKCWGKQIDLHLSKDNAVYLLQGRYAPTPLQLAVDPAILPAEANHQVLQDIGNPQVRIIDTELVVYSMNHQADLLVYKIDVSWGLQNRWSYFIDALTGDIVHRLSTLNTAGAVVSQTADDALGNQQQFSAWQAADGRYYMVDPDTPRRDDHPNPVADGPSPMGDLFILDAQNGEGDQLMMIEKNTDFGWDPAAVSAMVNTRVVYDYYLDTFGRKSLDDNDKNLLVAIHFKENYNNAFWNGSFMVYGDGDGKTFSSLTKCQDVAAHEMTHGVIENTANLIYQNQSGALNESMADVFAAFVGRDWRIGEECILVEPGFLRHLAYPEQGLTKQPGHMDGYRNLSNTGQGDNGGVHINSGIPSRAAYLLVEGLTQEGLGDSIGFEKAEQIYYRTLTYYLQASAQFVDAKLALMQAAEDLYPDQPEVQQAIKQAWDAVGVTDDEIIPIISRVADVAPGEDLLLYLALTEQQYNPLMMTYDLFFQVIPGDISDTTVLQASVDLNSFSFSVASRPAAYTLSQGTTLLYVGTDLNLYGVSPGGANQQLTNTGDIFSMAVSPDARHFAFTTPNFSDNTISLYNLTTDEIQQFNIVSPHYQETNASAVSTILYADSLAFDYTGRLIVFDALNCMNKPLVANRPVDEEKDLCRDSQGQVTASGGYRYWSIGILAVDNGRLSFPFFNQNPSIDVGYPTFASNDNKMIVMDVIENTGSMEAPVYQSKVQILNIETQDRTDVVVHVSEFGRFWSVPSFDGEDQHVVLKMPGGDDIRIGVAARIPLQDWVGDVSLKTELTNKGINLPMMHRAGVRNVSGAIEANMASLNFGYVANGAWKTLMVSLRNQSNRDVDIYDVVLTDPVFSHDAVSTQLSPGQEMRVNVTYRPDAMTARQEAALIVKSNGDPNELVIGIRVDQEDGRKRRGWLPGCTLAKPTSFDPILPLLCVMAVCYLVGRRSAVSFK